MSPPLRSAADPLTGGLSLPGSQLTSMGRRVAVQKVGLRPHASFLLDPGCSLAGVLS